MDILGYRKISDLSNSVYSIEKIYAIQKRQKVLYLRFKRISQKSSSRVLCILKFFCTFAVSLRICAKEMRRIYHKIKNILWKN